MRKHLSPGMILGVIAVVFACSGSAFAGSLITSGKIKDGTIQGRDIKKGTITSDRLSGGVRKELLAAGKPGPAGAKGDKGDTGTAGGTTTVQGSAPQKGDTGAAGKDGANPATLVAKSGDADWALAGGGGTTGYPSASLTGGQLHLQGGYDGSTTAGGIGIAHAYNNVPLSSLKTLKYDFRITKRPDSVSAPTIHVAVLNANTGDKAHTFSQFVFEPYLNGDFALNQNYSVDALAGNWWATRPTGDIDHSSKASWAHVIAPTPDATIISISVDNGGSSANTTPGPDFAADADNLVVGFGDTFTRYDFGG
jgi:hypothetical protein